MKAKITFLTTFISASMILLVLSTGNLHAEEKCLRDAWGAFSLNTNKGYEDAIKFADKCITDFGMKALKQQTELESNGIQLPPTGTVTDSEKHKIFQQGLLNDVATAYFIIGRSAEYLYKEGGEKSAGYKEKAELAYKKACEYKYGRTFDPRGWFWSPCGAASERLPLD